MTTAEDKHVLEAFQADPKLTELEKALSSFNLFDAIGATHKELWHSDFLAFLLDPARNHGLSDEFTKRFLRRALPKLSEFDSWEDVVVRREHRYVDILVQDQGKQVSVIIENKIWSPEAAGQLKWYWETISGENPGWDTYAVFLTPKGVSPTDNRYRPLSYSVVKEILEEVVDAMSSRIDDAVKLTIEHYSKMLGRSIVNTSGPEALARKLYLEHTRAIKLMDPARWKGWIRNHLEHLFRQTDGLAPETSTTEYVRFRVKAWDDAEGLKAGTGSLTSYPLFFFDFYNFEDSLSLYLWIGPTIPTDARANLLDLVAKGPSPFCKPVPQRGGWHYGYKLDFLMRKDYLERSDDELRAMIDERWHMFKEEDLPTIVQAFNQEQARFWKAPAS